MTQTALPTQVSSSYERQVIINIDDLGLSDPVNEAVIALGTLGKVGSTSYMAGGTISESQIRSLACLQLQVGLHLDFTGIYPSTLTQSLSSVLLASYLRRLDKPAVTALIHQQLEGFENTFNQRPVFIDGHQHVHQFPVIRTCLADVLQARYGETTATNQATIHMAARVTTPLVNDLKSWIIYLLGGPAWQQLCRQHQMPTNGRFGGAYDFDANQDKLAKLWESWFAKCPLIDTNAATSNQQQSPTLIMCHPALPNNNWEDEIKAAREQEYAWLMSDTFAALCQKYQVVPVGWLG
ncbi:ChbG/HpnK family deacetylase [Psychrobacter arenosus]|uniref:ChbG/HpnK family deacetylase n=1 Tax=Psychrobacter arenosus TaxID=256326 RepID=UPI00191B0B7E|nr:ChbG/HpnK family deacetylase [Psychrobacter arenosus]